MMTVAFIGLGNMGAPMAANLIKAGYQLRINDINPNAAASLVSKGAVWCDSAAQAIEGVDAILTMLPNGEIVKRLFLDEQGLIACATSLPLLIDCSTISPDEARLVGAAAKDANLEMIDAPVSGGVRGAVDGSLSFMVGGSTTAFERAKPLLSAMGRSIFHVGDQGAGQAAKICNNMMAGILMAGTAEVLALGVRNGLAPEILSEIMNHSSGGNFMVNRWNPWPGVDQSTPASHAYAGGFQVSLLLKDLGLALQSGLSTRSSTPLGAITCSLFQLHSLSNVENGYLDMSSIQRLYFPDTTTTSTSSR
jgi:3-hydroxyisobutyrate dehydrogenase